MKAMRPWVFVALITSLLLARPTLAGETEITGFETYAELATYYLQQRAWIAPLIPPFLPETLDYVEAQIAKGDYSFQERIDWYFSYKDGAHAYSPDGEIGQAVQDGEYLIVYEDLKTSSTRLVTTGGRLLAEFKAEPWPNLSGLKEADYQRRFLDELNKRSLALWVEFNNQVKADIAEAVPSEDEGGGGMMMLMGGEEELEIVGFALTNDGMAVTFAWPQGTFTNRLDIYSCDGSNYNGLGSWKLADIGYSTSGTNQLQWLDLGQLGRGSAFEAGLRFYTAGAGADVDSDGDGYSDSYEQFVLNTDPNDPDKDGDGVSDGPFDPDNTGSIVAGPDAFPLDPSEWLDTDGDGIGDNADTDDDGDGLLDASDPKPLMPRVVAPFKTVSIGAGGSFLSGYSSMSVAGNFQGWNPGANNMRLIEDYTWEFVEVIRYTNALFKFAANGGWTFSWGDNNPSGTTLPLSGTGEVSGANIQISGVLNGLYKFTFHETSLAFTVTAGASSDQTAEVFDISSAGRMLPYAAGGDARGFGQISWRHFLQQRRQQPLRGRGRIRKKRGG